MRYDTDCAAQKCLARSARTSALESAAASSRTDGTFARPSGSSGAGASGERTKAYVSAAAVAAAPATSTAVEGNGVAVQFPKNETACECFLHELSCEPPAEGLG